MTITTKRELLVGDCAQREAIYDPFGSNPGSRSQDWGWAKENLRMNVNAMCGKLSYPLHNFRQEDGTLSCEQIRLQRHIAIATVGVSLASSGKLLTIIK